jgi:hypothetical protein
MDSPNQHLPADSCEHSDTLAGAERAFLWVEQGVYFLLAALLSAAAVLALGSALRPLFDAISDWSSGAGLLEMIDQLLVALMIVEILHTVRASMRSGVLDAEPFLIVGLIASIRRMLVITLESSQATHQSSEDAAMVFRQTMVELAILGVLILVLVVSLFLLRRSNIRPGIRVSPRR